MRRDRLDQHAMCANIGYMYVCMYIYIYIYVYCLLELNMLCDLHAYILAQGRYVRVSEDHKPDRPDERRAVEARGGQVIFRGTYRVHPATPSNTQQHPATPTSTDQHPATPSNTHSHPETLNSNPEPLNPDPGPRTSIP